jgi:outer membrane protein OmpA-like peptidoglycan-associated protein
MFMKRFLCVLFVLAAACLALAITSATAQAQDQEGCVDHPLFNRMPNHHITLCETVEFDSRKFPVGPPLAELKPKHVEVEGARFLLIYEMNEGGKQISGLQVMRNFENATKSAGGTVMGTYPEWCKAYIEYDPKLGNSCANYGVSMKFLKGNKEIWAYMQVTGDTSYGFQIIEKEAMQQNLVVDAALLKQGLADSGHIAVYNILFDTGKSDLKPESDAALKEIAKLLTQDAALKLHVVGHTDNVGDLTLNMKLSQARAAAVVAALTSKHGIAANRLTAFGAGPYAPVASNKTDEGKAKNRRVELVEQ